MIDLDQENKKKTDTSQSILKTIDSKKTKLNWPLDRHDTPLYLDQDLGIVIIVWNEWMNFISEHWNWTYWSMDGPSPFEK